MLEIRGLRVRVPGRLLCADFSAVLARGEIWAVLGPNGAGKSTLLSVLGGLTVPQAGEVILAGRPLSDYSRLELARSRAMLLQDGGEGYWGSVADWVRLGAYPYAGLGELGVAERVAAALAAVGLSAFVERRFATLSGGERQRARFALLLVQAQAAGLVLLDEPLQHLDLCWQEKLLQRIKGMAKAEGKTVVMVLHDPFWASRICDGTLLVYGDGRVEAGPVESSLTADKLSALFGCPLREFPAAGSRVFLP